MDKTLQRDLLLDRLDALEHASEAERLAVLRQAVAADPGYFESHLKRGNLAAQAPYNPWLREVARAVASSAVMRNATPRQRPAGRGLWESMVGGLGFWPRTLKRAQ